MYGIFTYMAGCFCKCWYIFQHHGSHMGYLNHSSTITNHYSSPWFSVDCCHGAIFSMNCDSVTVSLSRKPNSVRKAWAIASWPRKSPRKPWEILDKCRLLDVFLVGKSQSFMGNPLKNQALTGKSPCLVSGDETYGQFGSMICQFTGVPSDIPGKNHHV